MIRRLTTGVLVGLTALGFSLNLQAAETENSVVLKEEKPELQGFEAALPLLKRFRIDNEYANATPDELDVKMFQAYSEGLVTDNEFARFYSTANTPPDGRNSRKKFDNSWKKVSFAFYEEKDTKMKLEVRPKTHSVMLRVTFTSPKPH